MKITNLQTCVNCGDEFPLTTFPPARANRTGYSYQCYACKRKHTKAYRAKRLAEGKVNPPTDAPIVCRACHDEQPATNFELNPLLVSGRSATCTVCTRVQQRASYAANKPSRRATAAKHRDRSLVYFKRRVTAFKSRMAALKDKPCADCNNSFPSFCMEFDHILPGKRYSISQMSNHDPVAVQEELDRCVVVCCCCHRVRTQARRPPIAHSGDSGKYSLPKFLAFKAWMAALKRSPCMDCGNTFLPAAMDFDHVRGEKVKEVGQMWSWIHEKVLAEIAKCDLVCACCHRIRTESRRTQENQQKAA